jgi:DNA-3-methyladenine glycosylase
MFEPGGVAYIYLCYGIHHLFNIVTAPEGMPHAVLVRAIEPVENISVMLERRNQGRIAPPLTAGPGRLSQALGLEKSFTGRSLVDPDSLFWIEDRGGQVAEPDIIASPRVGIDYAEECALWDWRFRIRDNKWTSKAP